MQPDLSVYLQWRAALQFRLGGEPAECICNLQLQLSCFCSDPLQGGEPAECIWNLQLQLSSSAIAAEHLQLQPWLRESAIATHPSAIVTESARAHVQLRLSISITALSLLCIQRQWVGWLPTASRSIGTIFSINLLRHSSSLAARVSCLRQSAAR